VVPGKSQHRPQTLTVSVAGGRSRQKKKRSRKENPLAVHTCHTTFADRRGTSEAAGCADSALLYEPSVWKRLGSCCVTPERSFGPEGRPTCDSRKLTGDQLRHRGRGRRTRNSHPSRKGYLGAVAYSSSAITPAPTATASIQRVIPASDPANLALSTRSAMLRRS
jgi:hypothetical protein